MKDKLKALHEELAQPVRAPRDYTLKLAVQDWLGDGMDGRSTQNGQVENARTAAPDLAGEARIT